MNLPIGLSRPAFKYKLTLWYVALFSVSLTIFEVYAYFEVRSSLFYLTDIALSTEADRLVDGFGKPRGDMNSHGGTIGRKVPFSTFKVRIVGDSGETTAPDGAFPSSAQIQGDDAPNSECATVFWHDRQYRVLTRDMPADATGTRRFIQVATPLDVTNKELGETLVGFLIVLPLLLLVASAGGLLLSHAAFQPVIAMTKLAAKVGEGNLSERLDYSGPADEIGQLAATFNTMIGKLEASFLREKRFTADASHELRTPLTALRGKIEVSLSRPRSAPEYRQTLIGMKEDIERLASLSADLLLLARLDHEMLASRMESVDLCELLDFCVDRSLSVSENSGGTVLKEFAPGVFVEGARDYLIRLFLNLLDNAIKYSDGSSSIRVRASIEGNFAVVEIRNAGQAIPEDKLPFLFQPFYRAEGDRSRDKGGSGLGLAIAHEIVDAHKGRIQIESAANGETTVTVSLPRAIA